MPAQKPLASEIVLDCVPKPRRLPVHCVDILAMAENPRRPHEPLPGGCNSNSDVEEGRVIKEEKVMHAIDAATDPASGSSRQSRNS
jgi:hypothetical protein